MAFCSRSLGRVRGRLVLVISPVSWNVYLIVCRGSSPTVSSLGTKARTLCAGFPGWKRKNRGYSGNCMYYIPWVLLATSIYFFSYFIFIYECVICEYLSHVCSAQRSQRRAPDPLGGGASSSCEPPGMGAGTQTQVP